MKLLVFAGLTFLLSTLCVAQTKQSSEGVCSPNVLKNLGAVSITCNVTQYVQGGQRRQLKLVVMHLPRNNEDKNDTKVIVEFFDRLQTLSGEIVYLRIDTYVGGGFGLDEVKKDRSIRAGVVFDFNEGHSSDGYEKDLVDGFGGNLSDYAYGYSVLLPDVRPQWGMSNKSTLLFPKSGNAFFDVHYMKAFALDGLAKIRISGMQGNQWIEIVPAQPFGNLLEKYEEVREKIPKEFYHEF